MGASFSPGLRATVLMMPWLGTHLDSGVIIHMKLEDNVAIVTGSGRGIGRAMAKALASEGAKVVLASRSVAPLEETAAMIRDAGGEALPLVCDVGASDQVNQVVATTVDTYGRLDIVINNAQGWGRPDEKAVSTPMTPFADIDEAVWDHTFQTGVKATYYFCKAAFPHLKVRGGKVINFGSPMAVRGMALIADYCANKEAIRGLSRSLAREWGQYGINVNVVCPSIETAALSAAFDADPALREEAAKSSAMGRLGDADRDAGPLAVFLSSSDSDYFTGHTFNLDGGRLMI